MRLLGCRAFILRVFILAFPIGYFCIGQQFYVYDWPNHISDVWPAPGNTLDAESGYSHSFYPNNGAGMAIEPDVGLFQTWQFSLYKNMITRLWVSEKRTRNPQLATSFIIPFDLGVHSYIDHVTGKPRLASPIGWNVQNYLREAAVQPDFWKNYGHDHFLFFSITAYQMVGIGVKNFLMEICQNCTIISIEVAPNNFATPYYAGRHRKYWYAVPYPSSFHWWEGIQTLPWALPPADTSASAAPARSIRAFFIGSVKTSNPNSNALRRKLQIHCEEAQANMKMTTGPQGGEVLMQECVWHQAAHACNGVVNASSAMLQFRESRFCPAPPGDSVTRKSLFDSLLAGCVPVLFMRASLSQYHWHLSKADVDAVSVYIPMKDVIENDLNFMDVLRNISEAELLTKQKAIARIAPTLQYAVAPDRVGNGTIGETWRPPFKDAVEVIIDRIVDKRTVEPLQGFPDEKLQWNRREQKLIIGTDPDYAGLRPGLHKRMARKQYAQQREARSS